MYPGLSAISVLVLVAVVFLFRRRMESWKPSLRLPRPKPALPEPEPAARTEAPSQEAEEPAEPLSAILLRLGRALHPLAENSAHPWELVDWPQFKAVVEAFDRPEVPLETLRQYACGDNWPLCCAAFMALRRRPDRNSLLDGILLQLAKIRPWALYFALGYVASLEPRPALGAAIVMAPNWWAENLVIPSLFREHFEAREKLGDQADFGEYLESRLLAEPAHVDALLQKIDHPFAVQLLQQIQQWRRNRLDLKFLGSFGHFWNWVEDERLLAEPEIWQEPMRQAASAILRDPPRSVMAIGEPRSGKTSFLKLLGGRLKNKGWKVFESSAAQLMANQMYIGQLEGRIRQLIAELDARKQVAWYVTDLLQLAESGTDRGQSASILDQIMPAVVAGRLVILGEATPAGLSRLLQLRPSARSLIEICRLPDMTELQAAALAGEIAKRIEVQQGVRISPEVLAAALQLAQQYLGAGQLAGGLIELLKRSAQQALAARDNDLGMNSLLGTLSQITGLPRAILDEKQRIDLSAMKHFFAERVMGQEEAVGAVVDRIAMLKAGLVDPGRPFGVFLFAGPTGTGKTELAKTLAAFLFGSPERMVRLDMSEFQSGESTVKILGRRGFAAETDSLVDRIRKQPFSVVLLDEFEKAHGNIWDLFLQIFDDGRLGDANGRTVDFRHCFIILTSNLGATSHRGTGLGFVPDTSAYSRRPGAAGCRPDLPARVRQSPRQDHRLPAAFARDDAPHPAQGTRRSDGAPGLAPAGMGGGMGGLGDRFPAGSWLFALRWAPGP